MQTPSPPPRGAIWKLSKLGYQRVDIHRLWRLYSADADAPSEQHFMLFVGSHLRASTPKQVSERPTDTWAPNNDVTRKLLNLGVTTDWIDQILSQWRLMVSEEQSVVVHWDAAFLAYAERAWVEMTELMTIDEYYFRMNDTAIDTEKNNNMKRREAEFRLYWRDLGVLKSASSWKKLAPRNH